MFSLAYEQQSVGGKELEWSLAIGLLKIEWEHFAQILKPLATSLAGCTTNGRLLFRTDFFGYIYTSCVRLTHVCNINRILLTERTFFKIHESLNWNTMIGPLIG